MFTVGGGVFTVGGGVFTVGRACLQQEEHINRTVGPPINGTGDDFFLGRSYFTSVSNDFSEKNGT